ncbi:MULTISPECIES: hypothetical protein [unclassified Caloramator]|uniref:hypothetical protein n=1 Tax=unclassified Caloramator TaxID=2629145 RepID=UPI00237EE092|nr:MULTISPECIES: hypothetical protein [unclassified Caloramator]MDO6355039.1 hypothetical protein [Caloramator sp. CAR-1]WDU82406.1 hypothetical protein PWK10_12250 [Caloramator sp. Dgby_cultured_2]
MLNRVAFNNFIEKTLADKNLEISEKRAGNLGEKEERILKEILYKNGFSTNASREVKVVSQGYITIDDLEKLLK